MSAETRNLLIKIEGDSKDLRAEFKRIKSETKNLDANLRSIAKKTKIGFTGLATTVGLTVKAFAIYENGLLGVGKTVGLTGKDLSDFGKDIQKLSTELPFASKELLGIAQSAGQLGVKGRDNILKFTSVIAKLGTASDLTGEEAATSLTRILNVTGENIQEIDKLASVIVRLGNNFAATESEIVRVTTEVTRATTVFGVSASEASALGASLKSVGIQAEGGGSAVGRAFRAIDASIRQGGQSAKDLSVITGIAVEDLKRQFGDSAVTVFQKFTEGLGEVSKGGGDVTAELEKFGLKGDEILKVLPVLALNSELVGKALQFASDETANATALNEEFAVQARSLNAETAKLKNTITTIAEQIGGVFAPTVSRAIVKIRDFLKQFLGLNQGTKETIARILGLTTIVAGLIATFASLGVGILALKVGFAVLATALSPVVLAFTAIGGAILYAASKMEALQATFTGVQAGFQVASNAISTKVNELRISFNELRIKSQELRVSMIEALPGGLFEREAQRITASINNIRNENNKLIAQNLQTKKSFAEVYDEIDGERLARKIAEEAEAGRKARDEASALEAERQIAENQAKLEADALFKEQQKELDRVYEEEKALKKEEKKAIEAEEKLIENELIALENEIRALGETEFNNEQIARLKKQMAALKKIRDKGRSVEQKSEDIHLANIREAQAKDAKERLELEQKEREAKEKFQKDFNETTFNATVSLGKRIFKEKTVAGKALLVLEKAQALASAVINTARAVTIALASAPPPVSYALASVAGAMGAVQIASIAGQAIGFNQGGVVQGVDSGNKDTVPAMLAPGEIVAPKRNFDEVIDGVIRQRGFVEADEEERESSGIAKIEISFTDEATQFITANQLENTTLGTSR